MPHYLPKWVLKMNLEGVWSQMLNVRNRVHQQLRLAKQKFWLWNIHRSNSEVAVLLHADLTAHSKIIFVLQQTEERIWGRWSRSKRTTFNRRGKTIFCITGWHSDKQISCKNPSEINFFFFFSIAGLDWWRPVMSI